jgi:uncharacterized protein DUF6079
VDSYIPQYDSLTPNQASRLRIREQVDVVVQPTVVRLEHLEESGAGWISDSYYVTAEIGRHLEALRVLLENPAGRGVFLIGHYGSGKSHFLAYFTQRLRAAGSGPDVLPVSLLNYKAEQPLERIIEAELGLEGASGDRRAAWEKVAGSHPRGLVLIIDELSEYLRAKPTPRSFNEDLRFLQFLGEWAQAHRLWVVAALQEQIEHTGEIEYDLFRKIKDRYPLRLLLTPAHMRDLIASRILRKQPTYAAAVEALARELEAALPGSGFDTAALCDIYPLHPATLELLEEVRDRFSQARGIIDFTITRLGGNVARGVAPFLDERWGELLTPDVIVDHFADLFEVQPEFLPIAQQLLPSFRRDIPRLFENDVQQALAWRLVKLMILVQLSPRREALEPERATEWLGFRASSIDPDRNRQVIARLLDTLAREGAYVKRSGAAFALDLEDDGRDQLERLLARTIEECDARGAAALESLVPGLEGAEFNPFALPRDRWHLRKVRWHFHDRDVAIHFGGGEPPERAGVDAPLALQIGLPWGPPPIGACHRIVPRPIELSGDVIELAALEELKERPLPARVASRIEERIAARRPAFRALLRSAYAEATLLDPTGTRVVVPLMAPQSGLNAWLDGYGEWLLRQTYPLFERFAPVHGPLPRTAYRELMHFVTEHDLGALDAPDFVKLIREAYLVPMGLMQRKGFEYLLAPRLDNHELVRHLGLILGHHPSPAHVYEHLAAPVYGLVPDQVHLLLVVLLIQGEIDIVKGERSYRDAYDTLPNPLQYDRVLPGRALALEQIAQLEALSQAFKLPVPKHWSVLAQKRAVQQLRRYARGQRDELSKLAAVLAQRDEGEETRARLEALITQWLALEKGEHELQAFQHFAHAIGSAPRFIAEANELASLPRRFEPLLRESERLRHLLDDPVLRRYTPAEVLLAIDTLGAAPPLARPDELEAWIDRANAAYRCYEQWYGERHELWRDGVTRHPVWSYRAPPIAASKHMLADARVREIEALAVEARQRRCAGLSPLTFHPLCRCGFDGAEAPLSDTLRRFDAARAALEHEVALFFAQDDVRAKVRDWADQRLELNDATLEYLEGKRDFPEVANIALFDQHLAGLDIVKPLDPDALVMLLEERVWQPAELSEAVERFAARAGPRIAFRRERSDRGAVPDDRLLAWCYEQALRQGVPLPPVFSRSEQARAAQHIDPRWVGPAGLRSLERLGLGEAAVTRVLELVLDGAVALEWDTVAHAGAGDWAPAVSAALALLAPERPATVAELTRNVSLLYRQHHRFAGLRPEPWLAWLDQLARAEVVDEVPDLAALLREHFDAQWVVVDCLGVALTDAVREAAHGALGAWPLRSIEPARVSPRTSTEAFYATLFEKDLGKAFEKINAVDELIHQRNLGFAELEQLAGAELEIAFRRVAARLDPAQPIIIFGDHGFRLAADGRGFEHGGASTLERLTLVLRLG